MPKEKPLNHAQETRQMVMDREGHCASDPVKQQGVLLSLVETMEEKQIPYAIIGGIAGKELGRPRVTHDIDVFLSPEDADKAFDALGSAGFKTERRDPAWLYKAWKDDILVDIIFKSRGDIYFDQEVKNHVRRVPYKDHYINAISPEDFIVIKAAVHEEHIPHHWHDALAVLTEGDLDWEYLIRRARFSPRRVLSLLIYAQSNDIHTPLEAIQTLYRKTFETSANPTVPVIHPYRPAQRAHKPFGKDSVLYTKGKIVEALSMDERIADHDIKITVSDESVDIRGEVYNEDQRRAVTEVIRRVAPEKDLKNHVGVRNLPGPEDSEVIQ